MYDFWFRNRIAQLASTRDHEWPGFITTFLIDEQSSSSSGAVGHQPVSLFLDQIKREKGVWWMPWQ